MGTSTCLLLVCGGAEGVWLSRCASVAGSCSVAHVSFVLLPVTLPATIMTSSVPTTVGGHMMYPSPHAVMYAPTSGLADGGLAVLNAFSQAPSAMQVSHSQVQDQGKSGLVLFWGGSHFCMCFLLHIDSSGFSFKPSYLSKRPSKGLCFLEPAPLLYKGFLEPFAGGEDESCWCGERGNGAGSARWGEPGRLEKKRRCMRGQNSMKARMQDVD